MVLALVAWFELVFMVGWLVVFVNFGLSVGYFGYTVVALLGVLLFDLLLFVLCGVCYIAEY